MKLLLLLFPALLAAQTVSTVNVSVNIQVLSDTVIRSKYKIKLPKGIWAASAVAENWSSGTMFIGQGSIVKALRDKGYPALSRGDAAAVILNSQSHGFAGSLLNYLPFAQKLLNDTDNLIVAGALHVTPWVGVAIAGTSAVMNALTPDILAQLQQFEQAYDSDGLQNITSLGSGQSAVGTLIFDSPPKFTTTTDHSFQVAVPVMQVTQAGPPPFTPVRGSCETCPTLAPAK